MGGIVVWAEQSVARQIGQRSAEFGFGIRERVESRERRGWYRHVRLSEARVT